MTAHAPDCRGFTQLDELRVPIDGRCLDWCFGCDQCEPQREGDHRVCGECLHVFRTPQELVRRHNDVLRETSRWDDADGPPPPLLSLADVDRIFCCPICVHDF